MNSSHEWEGTFFYNFKMFFFVCLVGWGITTYSRIFQSYGDVSIILKEETNFIEPQLLWNHTKSEIFVIWRKIIVYCTSYICLWNISFLNRKRQFLWKYQNPETDIAPSFNAFAHAQSMYFLDWNPGWLQARHIFPSGAYGNQEQPIQSTYFQIEDRKQVHQFAK